MPRGRNRFRRGPGSAGAPPCWAGPSGGISHLAAAVLAYVQIMEACSIGRRGNLGQAQRDGSLRLGVLLAGIGLVAAVVVVRLDLGLVWRLALFAPFIFSANNVAMGLIGT